MAETSTHETVLCRACGARLDAKALVCTYCRTLLHRDRLANLAELAAKAEAKGEFAAALSRLEQMLPLLPAETGQTRQIREKIALLRARPEFAHNGSGATTAAAGEGFDFSGWIKKGVGAAGAGLLLAWKFKFAVLALLSKGKLLLLGLSNISTVASMFAFLGVYWSLYGFSFALGIVLLIYVHEMGHVWAARQIGVPVTAPMFIPGFGAFIGLRTPLANAAEEAYLGLAGPVWGVAGSLLCLAAWYVSGEPVLLVLASFSAMINLFNLIPVWQLDGAHAFKAFTTKQRWVAGLFPLAMAFLFRDEFILLGAIVAGAGYQIFVRKRPPAEGHRASLWQFCGLVFVVALIMQVGAAMMPSATGVDPAAESAKAPVVEQVRPNQ